MANGESASTAAPETGKLVYQGKVVSDKMNKTIVVEVTNRTVHRLYKKYVTVSKRLKAHDENNEANEGDTVRVVSARPVSKEKRWRLLDIVERAR
jgi:small subunit ribosomal protein S17